MYNYDFQNEKVIYENINSFVEIFGKMVNCSILVTDKNILLFEDSEKDRALKGRGIQLPSNYVVFMKIDLKGINYRVDNEDTIINLGDVILYNINLDKIIK